MSGARAIASLTICKAVVVARSWLPQSGVDNWQFPWHAACPPVLSDEQERYGTAGRGSMTAGNLTPDVEEAVRIEEASHRLRAAMFSDREFIIGTLEGYLEETRGEMMTEAELRQALGRS